MGAYDEPPSCERQAAVWPVVDQIGDFLEAIGQTYPDHTWEVETDYRSITIRTSPELTEAQLTELRDMYAIGTPFPIAIRSEQAKDYLRVDLPAKP